MNDPVTIFNMAYAAFSVARVNVRYGNDRIAECLLPDIVKTRQSSEGGMFNGVAGMLSFRASDEHATRKVQEGATLIVYSASDTKGKTYRVATRQDAGGVVALGLENVVQ
jgi:hypothetical protein